MYTVTSPTSTNGLDLVAGSNTISATEVVQGVTSTATKAVVSPSTWTWSNSFDNAADPMAGATWSGSPDTGSNAYVVNADTTDADKEVKYLNGANTSSLWQVLDQKMGSNQRVTSFKAELDFDMTGLGDVFQFRFREHASQKGLIVSFNSTSTGTNVVMSWNLTTFKTQALTTTLLSRQPDHITYEVSDAGVVTVTLAGAGNTTETITGTIPSGAWASQDMTGFAYGVYGWTGAFVAQGWVDNVNITSTVASSVALPTVSNISVYNNTATEVLVTPGAGSADTTPLLKGTATAGATVKVYEGTQLLASTTADATTGAWSVESTALTTGAHTLSVRAVDANGNIGEPTTVSLLVNTTTSTWTYSNSFDNAIDPWAGATLTTTGAGTAITNADTSDTDLEFKVIDSVGQENIALSKVMAIGANQRMAAFTTAFDMDMTSVSSGTNTNRFELRYGYGFADGLSVKFAESAITVFWNGAQVVTQATALSARGSDRVTISMDAAGNISVGLTGYGSGSGNTPITVTGTVPTSLWATQAMAN